MELWSTDRLKYLKKMCSIYNKTFTGIIMNIYFLNKNRYAGKQPWDDLPVTHTTS